MVLQLVCLIHLLTDGGCCLAVDNQFLGEGRERAVATCTFHCPYRSNKMSNKILELFIIIINLLSYAKRTVCMLKGQYVF